ncbi:DUF4367 domain-containing protein [Metabacillus fastidiosus]|uniref:DUF4367 domain-containing protein n=1 Tax=Metabacillus fastidiosus TaxID=1458 RepID=A0ABU6NZZ7_9BACI|nr:DUF4367 domain-containing protein [Metabacillus fastidiosus]
MRCLLKILAIFILSLPLGVQAKEIKYNHENITISEIKEKVDFKVFSPEKIPNDWTLEIKTYPSDEKDNITQFKLHYMDHNDENLMVGILEKKERPTDVIKRAPETERIDINGNIGYFHEWYGNGELDKKGRKITGGILTWIQEGTYLEMNSLDIDKEQILEIARSMK